MVREYVGAGLLGALAADMDAEERAQREAERETLRCEQKRWDAVDALVSELCQATDLTARGALVLAGYHRHHRGAWRKWRDSERT